ncbi:MAG: Flp pilus assembly complex ATPase component TadA [Armatimonadetes bacterium]|nr:Flp pilus assembly complex ATPase component TadA [Armatimonadota bacterium]
MPRKPLAEYLLEKGYVQKDQIDEAEKVRSQSKSTDIGRVLVDLGYVGEREMIEAKAQEEGLTFVDLDRYQIDSSALNMVPERIARNHSVIPVRKEGTDLYLAMPNPNNIQAIDDVQMVSRLKVKPVRAVPGAIEDAIRRNYGGGNGAPEPGAAPGAAAPAATATAPASSRGDISQAIAEAGAARGIEVGEDDAAVVQVAEQAPIIRLANALIQQAITDRASDVHVEPQQRGVRVRYRVDGVLHEAMTVPKNLQAPLISRYKIMAEMNIAERRLPQDGRIEIRQGGKDFDLRVSSIPTPAGEKIVMRILDKTSVLLGLDKLGFTEEVASQIEELTRQPNGMFLSTGPTGAGKTTTQYSVLHKLNSIEKNIITIEDPIEYQLNGIAQVQVNRKAGLSFANALRHFLRQDPDIIMVGEMRDLETAEIAIEASLTGHLVLSTLHTNDSPSAVVRMTDMGVEPYLISATIIGVLAQRLGRKNCSNCKEPYEVKQSDLRRFGFNVEDPEAAVTLYRGKGCEECKFTGFRGRIGVYELMRMNSEIAELIVRRAPPGDIKAAAKANGMHELREDGLLKILNGTTTPEEIMRVIFTAGF